MNIAIAYLHSPFASINSEDGEDKSHFSYKVFKNENN